jgi:beta-lactamase superfamily II metal-dependent hydrolase
MAPETAPNVPAKLPVKLFEPGTFDDGLPPEAIIYFLLNIGDGDTQLIVLPERPSKGGRRAVVVDVGGTGKLPALVEALAEAEILTKIKGDDFLFPLVVATHPHNDHIAGMPEFVDRFKDMIRELWEPGYYHPNSAYIEMMRALEESDGKIQHTQPTSGTTRYIGRVRLQVLAPSIGLRNRFDSYGINLNNASLALKVEFPASGVEWTTGEDRKYVRLGDKRRRLLLGADSQALSWGQVLGDFPALESSPFPAYKALKAARGTDPLSAEVFKVAHHGSKHGVNIELVEEVNPDYSLISSVAGGGEYNFPHVLAQEAVREALEPTSSTGAKHRPDWELGIHYTGARDKNDAPLGTIALVVPPTGKITMWRFGDPPDEDIDLSRARRYVGPKRRR